MNTAVSDIVWASGTDLWIRWTGINKFNTAGPQEIADHGLAVDDFNFVPEPTSAALIGLAAVGLLGRRRRA